MSEWANVEEEWLWDGVCLLCKSVIVRAKIELQNGSKKNVKMGRKKGKKYMTRWHWEEEKKTIESNLDRIPCYKYCLNTSFDRLLWIMWRFGNCKCFPFFSLSLFPHMATWNESPLSTNLSKNLCLSVAHSSIPTVMETIENYDKHRKKKKKYSKLHDRGNISTKHHIKNIHRHTYTCTKLNNNNRKLTKKESG